jgi:hypothetical protein
MEPRAMSREEALERIARARELVRAVQYQIDNPSIAQCMRFADQNLHWAQWNLGVIDELLPELEDVRGTSH